MKQSKYSFFISGVFIVAIFIYGCAGQSVQTREFLNSPQQELVNYALSSNGATAESPDNNADHPPSEVIDGDASSLDWDNGGGWEGSLSHLRSAELLKRSYIQVNLPGKKQIKRIVVYTIDSPKYPASKFGLRSYLLEYWHGTGWREISFVKGPRNKLYTIKGNESGKIIHDVNGELITDKIRMVPLLSNDTEKKYNLTAFGGKPIYDITGSAKVIELQAWCYASLPEVTEKREQNNLFPIGKEHPSPDEQAIRNILSSYEQGYDNKNLEQVMSVFSDTFKTLDGKSRTDVEKNAEKFFNEYNNINIALRDPRINIEPSGTAAVAEANYTLECIALADGNVYRRSGVLTFNLRKQADSGWKITSAK